MHPRVRAWTTGLNRCSMRFQTCSSAAPSAGSGNAPMHPDAPRAPACLPLACVLEVLLSSMQASSSFQGSEYSTSSSRPKGEAGGSHTLTRGSGGPCSGPEGGPAAVAVAAMTACGALSAAAAAAAVAPPEDEGACAGRCSVGWIRPEDSQAAAGVRCLRRGWACLVLRPCRRAVAGAAAAPCAASAPTPAPAPAPPASATAPAS